jgi:hypothetical protein
MTKFDELPPIESVPLFGLGIGGNSAGHLDETGEGAALGQQFDASKPQVLFPFYVPGAVDAYLSVDPYSSTTICLPQSDDARVQMEPELALKFAVSYDDAGLIRALKPEAVTLMNDVTHRNASVSKLAEKKNWGQGSKGIASHEIPIDALTPGCALDHYCMAAFHRVGGSWIPCCDETWVTDYSYFHETLIDWIIEQINGQVGGGVLHHIPTLLAQAGHPKTLLVAIGAGRYNDYGRAHRLSAKDETLVALYDARIYDALKIGELIVHHDVLAPLSHDGLIFLQQRVVFHHDT